MNDEDRISIKSYVDALLEAHDRGVNVRFESFRSALHAIERRAEATLRAAEESAHRTETAIDRRFESVNEFRRALSDQTSNFVTRNEYVVEHKNLMARIELLEKDARISTGERQGYTTVVGIIFAVVIALGAAATALVNFFSLHK